MAIKYIIGIDEVGRGPLAGPVTVAAVCIRNTTIKDVRNPVSDIFEMFEGLNDSKKVTPKKREEIFCLIEQAKKDGLLEFSVFSLGNKTIDRKGIVPATQLALDACLKELASDHESTHILLDGGLRADERYTHQETIIKGDTKEPLIMLASIIAKVTRDRYMCELALKYPNYGFQKHKGYGTKAHYEAIKEYGVCSLHRATFLKKLKI